MLEERYRNKHVLVTGGAGFIGSHLVESLVRCQAHVTVLDNFSTGTMQNIEALKKNITIINGDVRQREVVDQACANQDIIFHLAAFISVPQSIQDPAACYSTNVQGTCNILEHAVKHTVQHVVFSSSSAIYGNQTHVCDETTPPSPCSPYAISKLAGEALCSYFSNTYGLSTTCLRYFNVYGERQNPNGEYAAVVAKFTDALRNKKPITIFGDGTQTRDFIHVDHVVTANIHSALQPHMLGEIINVGTGKSISLLELLKLLEEQLHHPPQDIIFCPSRPGDIPHSQANCNKFHHMLADA